MKSTGETRFTISIGGEEQDFGDAPVPYPTLLLDNAASHVIEAGFHLGNLVDEEPDGIPTVNADGDVPDEDGVTFLDSDRSRTDDARFKLSLRRPDGWTPGSISTRRRLERL